MLIILNFIIPFQFQHSKWYHQQTKRTDASLDCYMPSNSVNLRGIPKEILFFHYYSMKRIFIHLWLDALDEENHQNRLTTFLDSVGGHQCRADDHAISLCSLLDHFVLNATIDKAF